VVTVLENRAGRNGKEGDAGFDIEWDSVTRLLTADFFINSVYPRPG
jgi:hypothetical protein